MPAGTNDPDNGAWYSFVNLGGSPAPQTGLLDKITYKDQSNDVLGEADWSYESNRDLVGFVENKIYFGDVSMATVSKYAYVNDSLSRRTSVVRTGDAFAASHHDTWSYNDRNELTDSQRRAGTTVGSGAEDFDRYRHYTYDAIGNRTDSWTGDPNDPNRPITGYEPNDLNQYHAVGFASPTIKQRYVHDADGNLIEMYVVGDIDGDGDVDIDDLSLLTTHLGDLVGDCGDPNNLTCEQFARADAAARGPQPARQIDR